ncbi:MAG: hypothetical protein GWN86_10935, partial [Desulfobacterales bacterium]|nr:hypothetical protein [Desulfobacterales bacterium]
VLDNNAEVIEEYAKDLGVPQPVLQALAKLSLQPALLVTAAVVAKGFAEENWQQSYCPICGGLPAIAALVGEEGKREAL